MPAVVTLNVAEVKPANTVTEAGTVSTVLVFVSVTAAPPAEATMVKVTVQVPEAFGPKLAGQVNEGPLTIVNGQVPVAAIPFESFTWIVNVPVAVGVPVIAPVAVFSVRPAGSVPVATENV